MYISNTDCIIKQPAKKFSWSSIIHLTRKELKQAALEMPITTSRFLCLCLYICLSTHIFAISQLFSGHFGVCSGWRLSTPGSCWIQWSTLLSLIPVTVAPYSVWEVKNSCFAFGFESRHPSRCWCFTSDYLDKNVEECQIIDYYDCCTPRLLLSTHRHFLTLYRRKFLMHIGV